MTYKCDRKMGVEKNISGVNKINESNSRDFHRPVLRNMGETSDVITNRSSTVNNTSTKVTSSTSCHNSPLHINENVINRTKDSKELTAEHKNKQQVDGQKNIQQSQQARRERRPDRAVYIPRARRSQTTPPIASTTQLQISTQQQQPSLIPTTNGISKSLNQQLVIALNDCSVNHKPLTKADETAKINNGRGFNSSCSNIFTIKNTKKKEKLTKESKELREQRREQRLLKKLSNVSTQHILNYKNNGKIYECSTNTIPQNDREDFTLNDKQNKSDEPKTIHVSESTEENEIHDTKFVNTSIFNKSFENQFQPKPAPGAEIDCKIAINNISIVNNVAGANIMKNNSITDTMSMSTMKTNSNKMNSELLNETLLPDLCIEDVSSPQSSTKCDVETQELQRASKEINRSNRRIIKQTFKSDILQIPDHVDGYGNQYIQKEYTKLEETDNISLNKSLVTTTQIHNNTDDEEDDWENMYNDSGDCLDPKIREELTACVGKCKIEEPKMDYSAFLTTQSVLNEEEFPHVLEVSNFPVEFKNRDLLMIFSQYKESGYDIKWVDDTHALLVFSSSRIAAEVLTMGHPFVVLKPLAEATIESRLKAKKCATSLQPYRPRPETCAALARRLVTGALGVRLKTAAAERENEKRVLREAKERKLLAAKQRDEVWEN